jgi:hypothetical protein
MTGDLRERALRAREMLTETKRLEAIRKREDSEARAKADVERTFQKVEDRLAQNLYRGINSIAKTLGTDEITPAVFRRSTEPLTGQAQLKRSLRLGLRISLFFSAQDMKCRRVGLATVFAKGRLASGIRLTRSFVGRVET